VSNPSSASNPPTSVGTDSSASAVLSLPLRIWPAVVLLAGMATTRYLPKWSDEDSMLPLGTAAFAVGTILGNRFFATASHLDSAAAGNLWIWLYDLIKKVTACGDLASPGLRFRQHDVYVYRSDYGQTSVETGPLWQRPSTAARRLGSSARTE